MHISDFSILKINGIAPFCKLIYRTTLAQQLPVPKTVCLIISNS